jgi:uncharacterized protein
MNRILKNVIPAVGALAVIALAVAALIYVVYYGKSIQPSSYRSFTVSAEGKAVSIPDLAEFSFTVITQGGIDLAATQIKNTDDANKAIAFVKSQGVAVKDIKTLSYNVDPQYENYSCYDQTMEYSPDSSVKPTSRVCPPPKIVGYNVTQSVDVKIRDFKKISDIMGGVVTNGANRVGSLSFTTDDPTSIQDQARAEAIAKAKVKAEGVARAGGFSLGRLLGIQEGGSYPAYDRSYSLSSYKEGMGGAAAPAPTIEPGSQETNVTVTLTYEIR